MRRFELLSSVAFVTQPADTAHLTPRGSLVYTIALVAFAVLLCCENHCKPFFFLMTLQNCVLFSLPSFNMPFSLLLLLKEVLYC